MNPNIQPQGTVNTQYKIDFFTWHYSQALPQFINSRPQKLLEIIKYVNINPLFLNLFAPYKRMVPSPKTTISDRLSYELTSRFVGFWVRLILIFVGICLTFSLVLYEILASIFYLLPIFSISKYLNFQKNTFF